MTSAMRWKRSRLFGLRVAHIERGQEIRTTDGIEPKVTQVYGRRVGSGRRKGRAEKVGECPEIGRVRLGYRITQPPFRDKTKPDGHKKRMIKQKRW